MIWYMIVISHCTLTWFTDVIYYGATSNKYYLNTSSLTLIIYKYKYITTIHYYLEVLLSSLLFITYYY